MMNYTAKRLMPEFDCVYTDGFNSFPCYTLRKINEISPDGNYKIVGATRRYNGNDDTAIDLGSDRMTVIPTLSNNPHFRTIGYVPIETADHSIEYVAVQKERNAFATQMVTMMEKIINNI